MVVLPPLVCHLMTATATRRTAAAADTRSKGSETIPLRFLSKSPQSRAVGTAKSISPTTSRRICSGFSAFSFEGGTLQACGQSSGLIKLLTTVSSARVAEKGEGKGGLSTGLAPLPPLKKRHAEDATTIRRQCPNRCSNVTVLTAKTRSSSRWTRNP